MKKNNNKTRKKVVKLTKYEYIFMFLVIFALVTIISCFKNIFSGLIFSTCMSLLFLSVFNLIENIVGYIDNLHNVKKYGLLSLILFLIGSIGILIAAIAFENMQVISISIFSIITTAFLDFCLYKINRKMEKTYNTKK